MEEMNKFPAGKDVLFDLCRLGLGIHFNNDTRHEKTDLKVFVGVIPKEGWVRVAFREPRSVGGAHFMHPLPTWEYNL